MEGNVYTNAVSTTSTRTINGWAPKTDEKFLTVNRDIGETELIIRIDTDMYVEHAWVLLAMV